jgi:hypothetical protein
MGHCYEFETEIQAGCDHPMVAQADCCVCPDCGARCTGKFNGCAAVWARGDVSVELFAPARRGDVRTPDRAPDLPPIEHAAPIGTHHAPPEVDVEPDAEPEPATDAFWAQPVVESFAEPEREPPLQAFVVDTDDELEDELASQTIVDEPEDEPLAQPAAEPTLEPEYEPFAQPAAEAIVAEPEMENTVGGNGAEPEREPVAQPAVELTIEPEHEAAVHSKEEARAHHAEPARPSEFDVDLAWPDTDDAPDRAAAENGEPATAAPRLPASPESLYVQWSDTELQRVVASAFRGPVDDELPARARTPELTVDEVERPARARSAQPAPAVIGLGRAPDRTQSHQTNARSGVTAEKVAPRPPKPAAPVKVVMPSARHERRARRSRWLVVVGALAAVGVVAALAALGALLQRSSGDGTTSPPVAPGPTRLVFDTVTISDGITADRVWELHGRDGTRFEASVTYTNTTSAPVDGVHEEVVPKSLAASVDEIEFDSVPTTIIETDPVFQFAITVPANDELTLHYEIDVEPDGNRRARLEQWASDLGAEVARRAAAVAVPETAPPETTPPPPPPPTTRRPTSNRPVTPAPEPEPPPEPPPTEPPTTAPTTTSAPPST